MLPLVIIFAVAVAIPVSAAPTPQTLFTGDCSNDSLVFDCSKKGLVWTDGALRMNQIQVIGTHNSYHVEAPRAERDVQSMYSSSAIDLQYSHAALDVQFEHQHVRNLELDLLADPKGGEYKQPLIRTFAGLGALNDPALKQKGAKVLHIPDVDYHTVCSTLVSCLQIIKKWLDAHPDSVPIPMMMEFKTSETLLGNIGGAKVIPWDQGLLDSLDSKIRSVFRPKQLITPDDIRRDNLTLEESVLKYGWPDLDSSKGRIFFLMDNGPVNSVRDAYRNGRPNLEGRVLFTNSAPGQPDCAFQKLNDPTSDAALANIQKQVKAGYWVRTRADVPLETVKKKNCSTVMRDVALRSGAQVVSTDFPAYGMSSRWGCDYAARLPGGRAARCNPVNGPKNCDGNKLEPPEYTQSQGQ